MKHTVEQLQGMKDIELDVLAAREVMGWETIRPYDPYQMPAIIGWDQVSYNLIGPAGETKYSFCTDISAAMTLVEKMKLSMVQYEGEWCVIKPQDIGDGYIRGTSFPTITLVGAEGEQLVSNKSLPRAITIAAILAKQEGGSS